MAIRKQNESYSAILYSIYLKLPVNPYVLPNRICYLWILPTGAFTPALEYGPKSWLGWQPRNDGGLILTSSPASTIGWRSRSGTLPAPASLRPLISLLTGGARHTRLLCPPISLHCQPFLSLSQRYCRRIGASSNRDRGVGCPSRPDACRDWYRQAACRLLCNPARRSCRASPPSWL